MWRRINARYNLVGNECKTCNTQYFPQRVICTKCGRKSVMKDKRFEGNGEVYSYSRIHVPIEAFKGHGPYLVGIVKLDEGPKVEGHLIENGKEVRVGTRVKMAFRKMSTEEEEGLIHYHFKFEVV
jgi:hypothetical protein